MSNNKVYWKGFEELENDPEFVKNRENEFAEDLPLHEMVSDEKTVNTTANRRDFLKFLGFSVTAATLAACETPVRKAIPYVIKPETITPGVPNFYASSYYDGHDYYSILVKTREGRPIKIEGNRLSGVTAGSTNARVQASVISLYDGKRSRTATFNGSPIDWKDADANITEAIANIQKNAGKVVIISNTIISPSTQAVINDFSKKLGNVSHLQYDAVSYSAIREANSQTHGQAVIPSYHFDKALSIAGFGCDFLNGWLMSGVYEKQYPETRRPETGNMSRHFQFEATMSLAGSNADYRTMVKASEIGTALVSLYNYIAGKKGGTKVSGGKLSPEVEKAIADCGDHLILNAGKALVVCGLNDVNAQIVTNRINELLNSYGNTIDLTTPVNLYNGNDKGMAELMAEMKSSKNYGVILYGTNPAYTLPNGEEFNAMLKNAMLSVSFCDRPEETQVQYICPDHNFLESWNDYNPVKGEYSLQQPTIQPLFETRAAQESLLVWAGLATRGDKNNTTYREYIKNYWKTNLFPTSGKLLFDEFWNYSLHDGVYQTTSTVTVKKTAGHETAEHETDNGKRKKEDKTTTVTPPVVTETPVATGSGNISDAAAKLVAMQAAASGWDVVLYEKVGIGTGHMFNNPMLQEFPDPLTRVTWDNYVTMSPEDMDKTEFRFNKKIGQKEWQHIAKVTLNGKSVELPVYAMPGQAPGTIGIALGYGRMFGRREQQSMIGQNAFPFMTFNGTHFVNVATGANVEKTGKKYQLAGTQTHHTMMGRAIVKETSLHEYKANPRSGNHAHTMHTSVKELIPAGQHEAPIEKIDYWQDFKMINHRWGLSIDLNTCTGCGSCVVACHVENNVPVVGKDEVRRSRDMHWLRIDRYYTSDADPSFRYESGIYNLEQAGKMEIPGKNPRVTFQPVMCQHCNHAPCETVCPVVATTHSTEGLNQMTYNRCIGTRYCANNCPYKVRRFNWFQYAENDKFDYYMNDDLGKMVLNPDVTVRSRGVMEKCSMCVQRIQAGKLEAKKQSRMVKDQEIQTACAEACPTNAIVFGDFNDDKSIITQQTKNPRSYYLLEEIGVKPNVIYQTRVRNVNEPYNHKDDHETSHHTGVEEPDESPKKNAHPHDADVIDN